MLLATATTLLLLLLAAGCAERLCHGRSALQAAAFVPPIAGAWAGSLVLRTPTTGSAVLTFVAGDMALFALSSLALMRLLGGLPLGAPDPWGGTGDDTDGGSQLEPDGPEPHGGEPASTPRHPHTPSPGPIDRRHPRSGSSRPGGPRPQRPGRSPRRPRPAPGRHLPG